MTFRDGPNLENVEQESAAVNERVDRREAALCEQMEREWSCAEAAEEHASKSVLERLTVAKSLLLFLRLGLFCTTDSCERFSGHPNSG